MKIAIRAVLIILLFMTAVPSDAYFVRFKEQFYRLFHMHHSPSPDDIMENIFWLEQALKAPFANPLYAFTRIETEVEWEKYRYLFMMQINLTLIEQYILLGNQWNKRNAFFFNAPWRDQNLESLDIAERCYRTALYYWDQAIYWAGRANERRLRWIDLPGVQFWKDRAFRIENGSLNFARTINRELANIQRVRERFQEMDTWYYVRDTSE